MPRLFTVLALLLMAPLLTGAAPDAIPGETLLFADNFERSEADDVVEAVGHGWSTNSASRAKGHKQADLHEGVLRIACHPEANHAVSVRHDAAFTDGVVRMRFMLPDAKDSLGINIADLGFKGVHAGHLCMVRISPGGIQIDDLKAGKMERGIYARRKAGNATADDKKLLKTRTRRFRQELAAGRWYTLAVVIRGDTMGVALDGEPVGSFSSPGIAHPTKQMIRLSVARKAAVDDVRVSAIDSR